MGLPGRRPKADSLSMSEGKEYSLDQQVDPVKDRVPPGDIVGVDYRRSLADPAQLVCQVALPEELRPSMATTAGAGGL